MREGLYITSRSAIFSTSKMAKITPFDDDDDDNDADDDDDDDHVDDDQRPVVLIPPEKG